MSTENSPSQKSITYPLAYIKDMCGYAHIEKNEIRLSQNNCISLAFNIIKNKYSENEQKKQKKHICTMIKYNF